MDAPAAESIGRSKTPVGVEAGLPWGTHAYSPPERFTPQSTTVLPFASTSVLPVTWSPVVGTGAAVAGVAFRNHTTTPATARISSATSARPIRFTCIACPPLRVARAPSAPGFPVYGLAAAARRQR